MVTKQNIVDFQFDPIDLGIFYSDGHFPDHHKVPLFEGKRVPICTPEYAEKHQLFDDIMNLKQANFIHNGSHSAWRYWLDQMKVNIDCTQRCDVFAHEHSSEAARQSMGIALGRLEFDYALIESGELVAPFPAIESGKGYDLVCPQGMQSRAKFQAFSSWIIDECCKN